MDIVGKKKENPEIRCLQNEVRKKWIFNISKTVSKNISSKVQTQLR